MFFPLPARGATPNRLFLSEGEAPLWECERVLNEFEKAWRADGGSLWNQSAIEVDVATPAPNPALPHYFLSFGSISCARIMC